MTSFDADRQLLLAGILADAERDYLAIHPTQMDRHVISQNIIQEWIHSSRALDDLSFNNSSLNELYEMSVPDLINEIKALDWLKEKSIEFFTKLFKVLVEKVLGISIEDVKEKFRQEWMKLMAKPGPGDFMSACKEIAEELNRNKEEVLRQMSPVNEDAAAAAMSTVETLFRAGLITKDKVEEARRAAAEAIALATAEAGALIAKKELPSLKQFMVLWVRAGLGSFLFGFIDNYVMVVAGNWIDREIGAMLGLASALGAAAIGNGFSDLLAALGQVQLDKVAEAMGGTVEDLQLSKLQKVGMYLAGPFWIFIGCMVGWGAGALTNIGLQKLGVVEPGTPLTPLGESLDEDHEDDLVHEFYSLAFILS
jgi:hypothetical protein